jgi:cytochrome c-type biogenesis protein CcmH/NrfG
MSRDVAHGWFDRAVALCDLGRLDDAEEALRQGLRDEPDDPFAHALLSLVLADLDRGEEALDSAETAIALDPDLAFAHRARAQALLQLERLPDAEMAARELVRLDPESANGNTVLAAILLGRERWSEAVTEAEEALELEPESESALGLRAYALAMSDQGLGWQDAAHATLAAGPDSTHAHALAGYAFLARGGERAAVDRFREALRLDPESELAQVGLAEATKASHPLFKPLFRFYMWQERLPSGWKVALVVGPLILLRALGSQADNPFVIGLIAAWILFVALTWAGVPLANLALRTTTIGRSVLPSDQKRSSTAFLVLLGACALSIVLGIVVNGAFVGAAMATGLLAFSAGSLHALGPRLRRIAYVAVIAGGLSALVGGALVTAGLESAGGVLILVGFLAGLVLIWVVRLA